MPSPFPGMDPYIESPDIWEDFHTNLAGEIQAQLNPQLRPRYIAALIPRVTYEELFVETVTPHTVKPDVSILQRSQQPWSGTAVSIAPPPLTAAVMQEVPVRLVSIEIREVATGRLVTAIEILSPTNKKPGHENFDEYHEKRRSLMRSTAHLLEIDLLRQGKRFPTIPPLPNNPYFVFLHRGSGSPQVEIWPLSFQESIPVVPVPLLHPDSDLPLDLGQAVQNVYDKAAYDLRVDYTQPPPKPDLPPEQMAWIDTLLKKAGLRA